MVVPARDEQDRIDACLASVQRTLTRLPAHVITAVTIVLDRCRDATPERVHARLEHWPQASALSVAAIGAVHTGVAGWPEPAHIVVETGVGAVRDAGVRDALRRLAPSSPATTWVLNTDADTIVGPDWACAHVRLADAGADGVAGMTDLDNPTVLSSRAQRRYQRLIDAGLDGDSHHHVYGANLGVRADAYLGVGGFPTDCVGEDQELWNRLHRAGYPLVQPSALRVRTSARTRGRANGGLADLLAGLHTAPATSRVREGDHSIPADQHRVPADQHCVPADQHCVVGDGPGKHRWCGSAAGQFQPHAQHVRVVGMVEDR